MTILDDITTAMNVNTAYGNNTGNMSWPEFLNTAAGRQYLGSLTDRYTRGYDSGEAGYGLPGSATSRDDIYNQIAYSLLNPGSNQALYNWAQGSSGVSLPDMRSASQRNFDTSSGITNRGLDLQDKWNTDQMAYNRESLAQQGQLSREQMALQAQMAQDANNVSREIAAMQAQTQRDLAAMNAALQRDLQAGLITHQEAMQKSQEAHEKAMQQEQLAFQYAELEWTKEYGKENLTILRDRLDLDRETSAWQKANDERRVAVEEGRLGLERDRFGLDKSIQEAQLRANPYNAVANALYTRGAAVPGGQTEYGQYTTTLDNSGVLPFLQQLQQNGAIGQQGAVGGGMYMNQGGIGGNAAPNPNQISQASFGNMNAAERGITTSLAQYGGYDPNDYWQQMQRSWNTAGQRQQNFGGTRLG